jgi:hypothetical protein
MREGPASRRSPPTHSAPAWRGSVRRRVLVGLLLGKSPRTPDPVTDFPYPWRAGQLLLPAVGGDLAQHDLGHRDGNPHHLRRGRLLRFRQRRRLLDGWITPRPRTHAPSPVGRDQLAKAPRSRIRVKRAPPGPNLTSPLWAKRSSGRLQGLLAAAVRADRQQAVGDLPDSR